MAKEKSCWRLAVQAWPWAGLDGQPRSEAARRERCPLLFETTNCDGGSGGGGGGYRLGMAVAAVVGMCLNRGEAGKRRARRAH